MKKLIEVVLKIIIFFAGWVLFVMLMPASNPDNPAVWRFLAELIPLAGVIGFTVIFYGIEKRKVRLNLIARPISNTLVAIIAGIIWLGAAAGIVSTALFTALHGGAFEAGLIPVMNVLSMSILMTAVLEYTKSLLAPMIMHFLWNGIGALIIGGVSLADDYPHLFNTTFAGSPLISGGAYKIEGSIIVLFINVILAIGFIAAMKKQRQ